MSLASMIPVALANLFKKPATRLYPFAVREPYARTRGSITMREAECIFCGICQNKCPSKAIKVVRAEKTWQVDQLSCLACMRCVEVCPKKCIEARSARPAPYGSDRAGSIEKKSGPAVPPAAAPAK